MNKFGIITWYLDERSITESDANIILSDDQRRLHILKSHIMDAGSYRCVARNAAGDSAKAFQVEVVVSPNLNQSAHNIKVIILEGEYVELGCPISGFLSLILPGLSMDKFLKKAKQNEVIIESAQLENEGIYTCVGTNKGGSLDVDVHLTVLGRFLF
uniref:Ig-like domain-containing protein n=1 Tax=Onchocerca volvulus TaxID=6282 RepID=A0A8R1XVD4_ONCVO